MERTSSSCGSNTRGIKSISVADHFDSAVDDDEDDDDDDDDDDDEKKCKCSAR